ncbi:hypothetical protein AB4Y45_35590 [Paraburkholderia sp. EG287A]|uniref:hypothetical protein n=1 Tax=Paraburkholderia sp. EG287A TaxID=3237012 RepID=UPI0034D2B816
MPAKAEVIEAFVVEETPTRLETLRRKVRACFTGIPVKSRAAWEWLRFGKITEHVTDRIEGIACEVEYRGRGGKVVGFWAYGFFCDDYPYRGNGQKYGAGYDERPFQ